MADTLSPTSIGSRLRIMCARLRIWRAVPPAPTAATEALLLRFTHEAFLPVCVVTHQAWQRVADVYVPFYETLAAIETIEPGCVPDRSDLPTPASMLNLYQRLAKGSLWTCLTDDERIDAWAGAVRSWGTCAESSVQSVVSLCNLVGLRTRATRERWPLAAATARSLPDDGPHGRDQTGGGSNFFLVVSRPRPCGGRAVGLFCGAIRPCILVRFDGDATIKSCYMGEGLPPFRASQRDDSNDDPDGRRQTFLDRGRAWAHLFQLACLFADNGLFGLCPIATDYDLPPSVAIGLYNERRGVYDNGDQSNRRRATGVDSDPWTPGKKPHYGVWLDGALLDTALASAPNMSVVVQWFWTASRLDHAAAKALAAIATDATLDTILMRLDGETRKLLAVYVMMRTAIGTNPRRIAHVARAFDVDAESVIYRSNPALLSINLCVAIVGEYASRALDASS